MALSDLERHLIGSRKGHKLNMSYLHWFWYYLSYPWRARLSETRVAETCRRVWELRLKEMSPRQRITDIVEKHMAECEQCKAAKIPADLCQHGRILRRLWDSQVSREAAETENRP